MSCQMALMGRGVARAEKAVVAAKQAISSPLLEALPSMALKVSWSTSPAVKILVLWRSGNVRTSKPANLTNIIFGAVIDPELSDEIHMTVVATGFDAEQRQGVIEEAAVSMPQTQVLCTTDLHPWSSSGATPALRPCAGLGPPWWAVPEPRLRTWGCNKAKPWKSGGRLSDVLSEGGRRKSPFAMAADSEFGPRGYPGSNS